LWKDVSPVKRDLIYLLNFNAKKLSKYFF
jgi:hypothetical protein